jgi:hypothetical protein
MQGCFYLSEITCLRSTMIWLGHKPVRAIATTHIYRLEFARESRSSF